MSGLDPLEILKSNTYVSPPSYFAVQAVVSVAPGHLSAGPLTNWSQEESLLLAYHRFPDDAYSVRIQQVWEAQGLRVHFRESQRGKTGIAEITHAQPLMRLRAEDLQEVALRRFGSCDAFIPAAAALQGQGVGLPKKVCFLVQSRVCHNIYDVAVTMVTLWGSPIASGR